MCRIQRPHVPAQTQVAKPHRNEDHLLDKTRLCRFFARGLCSRGSACTFAHGEAQLLPQPDLFKTGLCFDYMKAGTCRAGSSCRFAHSNDELRPLKDETLAAPKEEAAKQLDAVHRKVAELQVQLQALQALATSKPTTRGRRGGAKSGRSSASSALKLEDTLGALGAVAPHEAPQDIGPAHEEQRSTDDDEELHFSRRNSSEEEWESSSWGRGDGSNRTPSPKSTAEGAVVASMMGYVLVIRKTFIDVQPAAAQLDDTQERRCRSVPPPARSDSDDE